MNNKNNYIYYLNAVETGSDAAVDYEQAVSEIGEEAVPDDYDEAVLEEEAPEDNPVGDPFCKPYFGGFDLDFDETKTTDYCGNVIYQDGRRMLLTTEGYVTLRSRGRFCRSQNRYVKKRITLPI